MAPRTKSPSEKTQDSLHRAVRAPSPRSLEDVLLALKKGADPMKTYRGRPGYADWTPLDTALDVGNLPAAEAMWNVIHSPRDRDFFVSPPLPPDRRLAMVLRACSLSELKVLQWLMGKDILPRETLEQEPLLTRCLNNEKGEEAALLKWLLAEGWDPNTPNILVEALDAGCTNPDTWRLLLDAGADPDSPGEDGRSARERLEQAASDESLAPLAAMVAAHHLNRVLPAVRPAASRQRL